MKLTRPETVRVPTNSSSPGSCSFSSPEQIGQANQGTTYHNSVGCSSLFTVDNTDIRAFQVGASCLQFTLSMR